METDSNIHEKIENIGKKLVLTSQRNNSLNNSNTLEEIEIAIYSEMQTNSHEEPIDLTFSQKQIKQIDLGKNLIPTSQQEINFEKSNFLTTPNQLLFAPSGAPKKRGRKRKDTTAPHVKEEKLIPNIKLFYHMNNYNNNQEESGHNVDNRHAEVLLAAKSLFSKRTRTLYHWMYPNTPKAQLKSAVSLAWETLGIQEKEFYISQVLGKFGFPQSSLMVNPQLGGLRTSSTGVPPLDLSSPNQINLETRNAISTILDSPNENQNENEIKNWSSQCNGAITNQIKKTNNKKRGRPTGKIGKTKLLNVNQSVNVENINEEFSDDPELRKEFAQFKWALHMSDKKN